MAEKKKQMTEIEALTIAVSILDEGETARGTYSQELQAEAIKKLDHMIEVRSRKRERKADDSKRLANIALGEQFAEMFKGETFKAADIAATLGVTPSKASAICKAMGWAQVPTTEKVNVYTL